MTWWTGMCDASSLLFSEQQLSCAVPALWTLTRSSVFGLKDSSFSLSSEHGVIVVHPGLGEGDPLFLPWP